MATFLQAKAPTEVVERRWTVPVDSDDGPDSASLSASGVTVDSYDFEGNELVLQLSGGTAAATGSITATITTTQGRTLVETIYIPVVASASQIADTARDYCSFALRKIIGTGNSADADELSDALEHLNGMIAAWRKGGADVGAALPITADTVIYCPDWAADAIRYNLRLAVYGNYGIEPNAVDVLKARQGLALVKQHSLPAERTAGYI